MFCSLQALRRDLFAQGQIRIEMDLQVPHGNMFSLLHVTARAVEKLQLARIPHLCMKFIDRHRLLACRNRNANVDQRLSRSTQHESERPHMQCPSVHPIFHRKHCLYVRMLSPTDCIVPGLKARAEQIEEKLEQLFSSSNPVDWSLCSR